MAGSPKLPYVIDTSEADCVMEFSWRESPDSDRALCEIIDQKDTSFSYAIAAAEATRAAINLKHNRNVPKLATAEVLSNCHEDVAEKQRFKGYYASLALEWIKQEGIAEDSAMPLDPHLDLGYVPLSQKAGGTRHKIDNWEVIPDFEDDIKAYVIGQPVVVSLDCHKSLFSDYQGGLVDIPRMIDHVADLNKEKKEEEEEELIPHSMILTGFGFYIFRDENIIRNFWEVKNSMGIQNGVNGYIHFLSFSSQDDDRYIPFDPMVPISLAQGERYDPSHLVKEMSLEEFEIIESDTDFDIVVMFYKGDKVPGAISTDFRRASRFYLKEKDKIFAEVNVTGKEQECTEKYGLVWEKQSAVVQVYGYEPVAEGPTRKVRVLDEGLSFSLKEWRFDKFMKFLFRHVG